MEKDIYAMEIEELAAMAQKIVDCPIVTAKSQKKLDMLINWIAEKCATPDVTSEYYIRWLASQSPADPLIPSGKDNIRELDKFRKPD
jgi:hypothetical protein